MTQLNGQNRQQASKHRPNDMSPSPSPKLTNSAYSNGHRKFFEDVGVWKDAPLLKGSTKFEPLPDVKNIMITGGAGFM